ncbi:MAG: hypothetical protein R6T93_14675 [Trueperaceae bacterium]
MTWLRAQILVAVVALATSSAGAWSLAGTPYGTVVDDLLRRFHAEEHACRVAQVPAEACFVVEPGRAAQLAEEVETFLEEHAGAVVRGSWSSANGTHRVAITLPDAGWGALELWLTELPGHGVEGRFQHLPERGW